MNREIYEGEEHFEAIVEINDELMKETKDLKEINKTLKRENEQLEMDVEVLENDWGKCCDAKLEDMEDNAGEFFMVMDELMDEKDRKSKELMAETEDLKEINKNLKRENKQLEKDIEVCENEWGICCDGDLEDMEDNAGEFFVVIDEMMDEKDKKTKKAKIREQKLRKKYKILKNKYNSLERKIRFKNIQLEMKNKMIARRIKTIINKEEKERKYSTYSDEKSHLYDELYEGLCTYENTMTVQPEREQKIIPISHIDKSKIKETVHERQDMLLDEFLKNEFKIHPEYESESE